MIYLQKKKEKEKTTMTNFKIIEHKKQKRGGWLNNPSLCREERRIVTHSNYSNYEGPDDDGGWLDDTTLTY